MEGFGELAPNGEEFVIGRPDTPRPWFNLLTNNRYRLLLAQNGQANQALSKNDEFSSTFRLVYIRDLDTNEFWTLTGQLIRIEDDLYQCRYGINRCEFRRRYDRIDTTVEVFVPENFDGEIWRLKIHNCGEKKRRIAIFFVAGLPDNIHEAANERGVLIGRNRLDSSVTHFCVSDRPFDSFDCLSEKFFGSDSSFILPKTVVEGRGNRSLASGEKAILATTHNLTLGNNTARQIAFFVGATTDITTTRRFVTQCKRPGVIEKIALKSSDTWQERLAGVLIKTPDQDLDRLFNQFLLYQSLTALNKDRLSYIQGLTVGLPFNQTKTEEIESLLAEQTKDGKLADINSTVALIELLVTYLKEIGRFEFMHRNIAFVDGGTGSVLLHFIRALNYCQAQLSTRDLIYIKSKGDDKLESTALTGRVAYGWREAIPVLEHFGEHHLVDRYSKLLDKIKESVDKHLRLGRYYTSGISAESGKIGLRGKPRQIEAESQSWLIISQLINPERAKKALAVVARKLGTRFGTLNFAPAYPSVATDGFTESSDSPGTGRNSTIVTDVIAKIIWAETIAGRDDEAQKLLRQINPLTRSRSQSIYGVEPYIVADSAFGPAHPRFGQGVSGWSSSGAGSLRQVIIERVLGIQPVLGGLKINPCLPKDWRQVEITRRFRGADYHIRIQNPFRVSKGIDRIIVDGVRLTGNVIRPFAGGSHFVEVTLG